MNQFIIHNAYAESRVIERELVDKTGLTLHGNNPYTLMLQIRTRTEKQGRMATCALTKAQCLELAAKLQEFSIGLDYEAPNIARHSQVRESGNG